MTNPEDLTQPDIEESDDLTDIYEFFSLPRDATTEAIKKTYRKLALQYHPDKCSESQKESHTKKFHQLSIYYAILSDPVKRGKYDKCGNVTQVMKGLDTGDMDWETYFKELYASVEITGESIEAFAKKYKGSEEEKEDLLNAYNDAEGDMDVVLTEVPLSTVDDEDRFREIMEKAVKDGVVERFEKFFKKDEAGKKRRKKEAEKEAAEAQKMAKEMGIADKLWGASKSDSPKSKSKSKKKNNETTDEENLRQLMLQGREERMSGFFDNLEQKYGKKQGTKSSSSKKRQQPPTDEEFEALQAKLFGGKKDESVTDGKKVKKQRK